MSFRMRDIEARDMEKAWRIYRSNLEYFKLMGDDDLTIDSLYQDIKALPKNISQDNKFFRLIDYRGEDLGLVDYVYDYPEEGVFFIGLLLIDSQLQGLGYGRLFLSYLEDYAAGLNFKSIRLGVLKNNRKAYGFWQELGFKYRFSREIESKNNEKLEVCIMEKEVEYEGLKK